MVSPKTVSRRVGGSWRARRRAALIILAVAFLAVVLTASASPARPNRSSGPVAIAASFPESADVAVPGPGDGTVQSSQLPATTSQATMTVESAQKAFDQLTEDLAAQVPGLSDLTKRSQRIVTCFYVSGYHGLDFSDNSEDFDIEGASAAAAYLNVCLRLAFALSPPPTAAADAASKGCFQARKAVAVTFTRTRTGVRAHVHGRTRTPSGRGPLSVSCRHVGKKLQFTLRARARGRKLRSVVGSTVGIGFVNPSRSPVTVRTTIAVR
jgi:hypothetical protein